jgi:exopolysaccharide biosynthesis protein
MLVQNGQVLPDLDGEAQPRSAIGLDKSGRRLILVVVDGRQPRYSQGATLEELAAILIDHGAHTAMNLDGGGSTSLAIQKGSHVALLNSPINHGIPGWERPVGNHLGIFASPSD